MIPYLLLFTWRLVPITSQVGGTCVAHAISACESIYNRQISPQSIIDTLWIWLTGWYEISKLPQTRPGVSTLKTGNKQSYISQISQWPLLVYLPKWFYMWRERILASHEVCGVWYDRRWIIYANSYGTGRGYKWYGRIPRHRLSGVMYQTIGTGKKPSTTWIRTTYLL